MRLRSAVYRERCGGLPQLLALLLQAPHSKWRARVMDCGDSWESHFCSHFTVVRKIRTAMILEHYVHKYNMFVLYEQDHITNTCPAELVFGTQWTPGFPIQRAKQTHDLCRSAAEVFALY